MKGVPLSPVVRLVRATRSLLVVSSAAAVFAACSSSEVRSGFDPKEAGRDGPDPTPTEDAGEPRTTKPPFDPTDEPVECATDPCASELVAGHRHFCARMSDETVRCWGDHTRGSLGSDEAGGGDGDWRAPTVTGVRGASQLSAGGATTCALVDGSVLCWGDNDHGQLGLDATAPAFDDDPHPTPAVVPLPAPAVRVDVGPRSACAVLDTSELHCWGDNSRAQLARPTPETIGVPGKAEMGNLRIVRTALGTYTSLGLTDAGEVVSWGAMGRPEGSIAARESSLDVDARPHSIELGSVTSLAAGPTTIVEPTGHPWVVRGIAPACGIAKGELFCWGDSLMGALGMGVPELLRQPRLARLESETAWAQRVAVGADITCARLTDGSIECAGDNRFGALGKELDVPYGVFFRRVQALDEPAVSVAVAEHTVCALVRDGSVLCWGSNAHGELGQGTTDGDAHPTPVRVRF